MGCGESKVDHLPLVSFCRERKELIKAARDHRYALAAAHVSYFRSLKEVGDALCKFVDEELVVGGGGGGSLSPPGSPVLTLPSNEGKGRRKRQHNGDDVKNSSSSTSISHSIGDSPVEEKEIEGSHLHLSSGSESERELGFSSGHIQIEESPTMEGDSSYVYPPTYWGPSGSAYAYPPTNWGPPGANSYMYYGKKSATLSQRQVYEPPERYQATNGQWPDSSTGYSGYPQYGNGGFFGLSSMGSPPPPSDNHNPSPAPPPDPPAPNVSTWDFLNVFDTYDHGYLNNYSRSRYAVGSSTSSPDSKEIREREGIPDLEEETEQEVLKEVHMEKKKLNEGLNRNKNSGEGTSRGVPSQSSSEGTSRAQRRNDTSRAVPMQNSNSSPATQHKRSSPDTIGSNSPEEENARKKGVSFEIDESATHDIESSMPSSLTTLSTHGTRDLQEAVKEIRDEFETASSYGKEVALLLEVGKLPYQPRGTRLKVIFSRIMYLIAPSLLSSQSLSRPPVRLSSRSMKMAKAYYGDSGKNSNTKPGNLLSTLEKLYEWEKKLHREVKDEERLRILYDKKCKRLKALDEQGAETSKIDATQASVRKLLTKINVSIRAVAAISGRIHKLRDQEFEPQVAELIHGLIRMWKSMFKCHQKQFQAIVESKMRSLTANTGFRRDSSLRATLELEMELLSWCTRFNNWINTQKSYIDSLNRWLLMWLPQEPEETADGVAPFSPSRIGAPPIFIICNDWHQAMKRISEDPVANSMQEFASSLHQLWERQDDEQRQRIKAEYLSKDFEKRLRTLRMEKVKVGHDKDTLSDKTAVSKVSESGVSPLDDLKVDLDSMRKTLEEERTRHKESIRLVHDAASNSLQAGLVPIFESLGNFTSEVLKAHEQVRLQNAGDSQA